jgi:hypothetical protein
MTKNKNVIYNFSIQIETMNLTKVILTSMQSFDRGKKGLKNQQKNIFNVHLQTEKDLNKQPL